MLTATVTEQRHVTNVLRIREYRGRVHLITWLMHYCANPNREG